MSEVSSIVCTFLCNVQIIYIHAYTIFFLFFSCILLINQTHTHTHTDLWLSRRLWNDQGRRFQTHGRDHQSEAYQATLTRTLSQWLHRVRPPTQPPTSSTVLTRPQNRCFQIRILPSFSLCLCLCVSLYLSIFVSVSVSLCSYFCCFCVSLFMCLLSSISHSHCPYIHKTNIISIWVGQQF